MRISDDRYNRDIRRHTLAMRLIRHQARTDTIKRWTGLSAFRIRALVHTYTEQTDPAMTARHRGAAPRKLNVFRKTSEHEIQTLALVICCQLEGLIPKNPVPDAPRAFPSLETGEKLCDAFESFQRTFAKPQITLEHAILLTVALASAEELVLDECDNCGGLVIINRLEPGNRLCIYCRLDSSTHLEGASNS